MSRFKDIFSNKPENMSTLVKWVFGLPFAYLAYLLISMILPSGSGNPNAYLVALSLRSLLLIICTINVVAWFVGLKVKKLFNEKEFFSFPLFFKGLYVMVIALVVTNLCLYFIYPESFVKNSLDSRSVFNWIFSLLLVVISAFSEELIFRSYIGWFGKTNEDFLTTNIKKILIYALVSALLFAIAHFSNPEVAESAVWSMLFYFIFGFCLMLCFFKTKGLEFGLGVHVANNLFAAWFVNYNSSVLPTESIFTTNLPISFITVLQAVICLVFCTVLCPENN